MHMKEIRVLYVLNNPFNHAGTESVVLNYYRHIGSDIKIDFAVHATEKEFKESQMTQDLIGKGVRVFRITPRKESIKRNYEDLIHLMSGGVYDIVHSHTDAVGAVILKAAKRCGIKNRIAHSHNTNFTFKLDSLKTVIKALYLSICRYRIRSYATSFMACSKKAGLWLFGSRNIKKTYILNNAIEVEKYRFSEELRNKYRKEMGIKDCFVLGNVGRLTAQKNQLFLLDCFRMLYKDHPDFRLLLIGEGSDHNKLEKTAVEYGIMEAVIFFGESERTWELLNVMDIFLFPSLFEGLGMALLEAQANGLRCIANDSVNVPKDSSVTGQVKWITVKNRKGWIDAILDASDKKEIRCPEPESSISEHGYDITKEAWKLSKIYLQMMESNNVYSLEYAIKKETHAGYKATSDLSSIFRKEGYVPFNLPVYPDNTGSSLQKCIAVIILNFKLLYLSFIIPNQAFLLYQHPAYGARSLRCQLRWMKRIKGIKSIAVIHDLNSLRGGIVGSLSVKYDYYDFADRVLLKEFDTVICHNEKMRQYLIKQGFLPDRLINMEIFDYLTEGKSVQTEKGSVPSIAIAGNLTVGKSGYIYELIGSESNRELKINLYGSGFQKEYIGENTIYHGSFDPDILPGKLEGDFGLVWDGPSIQTCAGNTGEYLKYNNPHKLSLYLASGMPVIVWSQSAAADFVRKNGVGIVVDSLYGLGIVINNVSHSEYDRMRENVRNISNRIRNGYYSVKAIKKALYE